MARVKHQEVLKVDREKLIRAITSYEDYPQFVEGCTRTEVDRGQAGRVRVKYFVSLMKDIEYTLDHVEDRERGTFTWELVESEFMKVNSGKWTLAEAGAGKLDVTYEVEVEFRIPVPGFVLNRLVKGSLPSMVRSFLDRANAL